MSQEYKLVSGDTATKICKKFNISLDVFKKLNPQIKDINKLSVGQIVKVGEVEVIEELDEVLLNYFDENIMYYIIPKNQTWLNLEKLTDTPWIALADMNRISEAKLLKNQVIKIPIPQVTVHENDTLIDICKNRGVDYKNVAKINVLQAPYMIYPNQILELIESYDEQLVCIDSVNNPIIWKNYTINLEYGIKINGITNEMGETQRFYTNIPINIISIDFLEGGLDV